MEDILQTSPSTFPTADIPDELLHDETHDLQEDAQTLALDYGYNSSSSSTQHSTGEMLSRDLDDDEPDHINSRASSRSSISSLPGSVVMHPTKELNSPIVVQSPDHILHHTTDNFDDDTAGGNMDGTLRATHSFRARESAFRKPSSVKAMQMHTEDEDDEYLTPTRRQRGMHGHRTSDFSMRSMGSSPLKRSPYYSPNGSASKQKVKKEYPLVLLHCTLLPPTLSLPGTVGIPNQKILKEVLPPQYWRRWKLLEEKVGSGVLRERGVLISHPEDAYDLLEERLLESLELQRPRLHNGHFLGPEEGHDEKEDHGNLEGLESATDDEQGETCLDCGTRVVRHNNEGRKWEIKVYAANGLMRAGAWAAAWKEMEKVDVEVGLWLPSELRRELEGRIMEEEMFNYGNLQASQAKERAIEAPAEPQPPTQEHIDGLDDAPHFVYQRFQERGPETPGAQEHPEPSYRTYNPQSAQEIDLGTLLINYVRVLASDRRNVAIVILSVLVAFLAIGVRPTASEIRPFPRDFSDDPIPTSIITMTQYHNSTYSAIPMAEDISQTSVTHPEPTEGAKASGASVVPAEPVHSDIWAAKSVETEEAARPKPIKPLVPETEDFEPVKAPVAPEPVHTEVMNSESASSESVDTETVEIEGVDLESLHPEPMEPDSMIPELAKPGLGISELVDLEQESVAEPVDSSELINKTETFSTIETVDLQEMEESAESVLEQPDDQISAETTAHYGLIV